MRKPKITWQDFERIEMRVGTILEALNFPKAQKPAYQLSIDFGKEIGIKKSSAQLTTLYTTDDLVGKQVIAVLNFPPKKIADFWSECLVLGLYNAQNQVVLLQPEQGIENGSEVG